MALMAHLLLDRVANIDIQDNDGVVAALIYAAREGHTETEIAILLRSFSDTQKKSVWDMLRTIVERHPDS